MRANAVTLEPIRWPEYLGCVLALTHQPDLKIYAREGQRRCVDCRIDLERARTWRWRLLEWVTRGAVAVAVGGTLFGTWLLQ